MGNAFVGRPSAFHFCPTNNFHLRYLVGHSQGAASLSYLMFDALMRYLAIFSIDNNKMMGSGGRAFMEGEKGHNTFIETSSELFCSKIGDVGRRSFTFGAKGMFSGVMLIGSCLVGPSSILHGFFEWRKRIKCSQKDRKMQTT